jgi:dihydrofolate reductase
MRKLIEHSLMTLDGVFADPVAWGYRDYNEDERFRDGLGEVSACDAMLFGRVSYEASAPIFGQRTDAWAARMTAMKKYVFSATLERADWNNSTIIRGDAVAEVAKLKDQEGGDLLIYGHTSLAEALFRERLIDVFQIALYPVILGHGRRFFREGQNGKLRLIATKTYSKGGVRLTYEPQY